MPIYTFSCSNCQEEFTRLVGIDCGGQVSCPQCGSGELRRLFRSFDYVRVTKKYDPACRSALNCVSAKRFGCGKYARNPVPPIS
jgi:putative FmdB family regulatory protein